MADHLEDGTGEAYGCGGGRRQQDVAHMPNRAVSHHALHIPLGNRRQGAIQHRNPCPNRQPGGHQGPGLGKQSQAEAQQPVGA